MNGVLADEEQVLSRRYHVVKTKTMRELTRKHAEEKERGYAKETRCIVERGCQEQG